MGISSQYTWGVVQTTGLPLNWGATYAANSTNRSKRTAYDAAIELTRPVAHAVRLSCPLAPTQASGFVHMALATETNWGSTLWQFPNTVAQMSGCQHYKRVTLASLTQSLLLSSISGLMILGFVIRRLWLICLSLLPLVFRLIMDGVSLSL